MTRPRETAGKILNTLWEGCPVRRTLRVIFTADCHGYFYPTDYFGAQDENMGLLKLIASFERDENTLVIDGGDTIQGSPFTDWLRQSGKGPGPVGELMNLAGYDCVVPGNHDFDYGCAYLGKYLGALDAKCLCANVRDREGNLPVLPYIIRTMKNGLRVGIAGVCTEKLMRWDDRGVLDGLVIRNAADAAGEALREMREKTDVRVCVYHGGFERDPVTGVRLTSGLSCECENRAEAICALGYDLVLCAHQHRSFPGTRVGRSWTVQVMNRAKEFSVIDMTEENGVLGIVSENKKPGKAVFRAGKKALDACQAKVNERLDRPIGEFTRPLVPEGHLLSAFRGSDLANFFNRVQAEASGTDISACNLYNDVRGFGRTVTIRDVMKAYRFPNTLVVLRLTGEVFRKYLEQCARYFALSGSGEVRISREYLVPKAHHYHFDYLYGIRYDADLRRGPGNRIGRSVRLSDGKEIRDGDVAEVCFSSYRATGIGGFDMLRDAPVAREIPIGMQELIVRYFRDHPRVTPEAFSAIRFTQRDQSSGLSAERA